MRLLCDAMLLLATAGTMMTTPAQGRVSVEGSVTFAESGAVCPRCPVLLHLTGVPDQSALTSDSGFFRFQAIPPGSYVLRARVDGYDSTEERVNAYSPLGMAPYTLFLDRKVARPPARYTIDVSEFLDRYPKEAVSLFRKASKNADKGKAASAIVQYEGVLLIAPDFYQAHEDLGYLYQQEGRLEDAEREFVSARDINPSAVEPLMALSLIYIDKNEPELAVQAGDEAVHRNSHSLPALYKLLETYLVRQPNSARRAIVELIRRHFLDTESGKSH